MSRFSDAAGKAAKFINVINAAKGAKDLPKDLPLAYSLMLDSRTPLAPKAWFGAKFAFMAAGVEIPFVGEVDIYLALQACRTFISSCERIDPDLVAEHREALANHTSIWDRHTAAGLDTAKNFGKAVGGASKPVAGVIKRVPGTVAKVPGTVADVARRGIDKLRGNDGLN